MATPLVVDSSVVVRACVAGRLAFAGSWHYLAPPLMWSEVGSALHEARWRAELEAQHAVAARRTLRSLPITSDAPMALQDEACNVADELGLAKTYDGEFIALARLRGCQLVTADARLLQGARRLGFVLGPAEVTG